LRKKSKAKGSEYKWEDTVQRVHFLGVEADLCDLKSVYALADRLVNGTVGSPDARTIDGRKLPHGSPGTQDFSKDIKQDRWALSQEPGSIGVMRSWGWGLSGIRVPRLDVLVLNAGMGGWLGIAWFKAVKHILGDLIDGVTWPNYKIVNVGSLCRPQFASNNTNPDGGESQPLLSAQEKPLEPPLGELFCSNIFGHYILAHELMPILSRPASPSSEVGGKIIWVSSLETASDDQFHLDDIQGLKSEVPYESTKRLSDLISLSSELHSVQEFAAPFFDPTNTSTAKSTTDEIVVKPRMYLTHPGIFASEIFPLNFILVFILKMVFYVARFCGSPWHNITAWKAAVAPVWLALSGEEVLETMNARSAKWGSATDRMGEERVMRTEVPGWGFDGTIDSATDLERRIGRRKNAVDATRETREEFEVLGGKCWREMEELRVQWEGILGVKTGKK
jgi:3-keto steroid reductase